MNTISGLPSLVDFYRTMQETNAQALTSESALASTPALSDWERCLTHDCPIFVAAAISGENGLLAMNPVWFRDCSERLVDAYEEEAAGRAALAMQGEKDVTDVHVDPSSFSGKMTLRETGEIVSYTIAEQGDFIASLTIADGDGVILATMGEPRSMAMLDFKSKTAQAEGERIPSDTLFSHELCHAIQDVADSRSERVIRAHIDAQIDEVYSRANQYRDINKNMALQETLPPYRDVTPQETMDFDSPIHHWSTSEDIRVYHSDLPPFPS